METLKLEKFQDSKLDNLQMIKGGGCYTTLDGVEEGDYVVGDLLFIKNPDGVGYTEGNPDTTNGAC